MDSKYKVYVCGNDARYHIPFDACGVNIYFSIEDLKAGEKCWEECGIVELVLDCSQPNEIVKENWELAIKNSKSFKQIAAESMKKEFFKIFECIRNIWNWFKVWVSEK